MGYLIVFVIALAISSAMQPKQPEQKPVSLGDFNMPTAEPGRPIPVVMGTYTIKSPNIVWYGDLGSTPVKTKGGK